MSRSQPSPHEGQDKPGKAAVDMHTNVAAALPGQGCDGRDGVDDPVRELRGGAYSARGDCTGHGFQVYHVISTDLRGQWIIILPARFSKENSLFSKPHPLLVVNLR